MKSVASTPLRFIGMVVAINAALIAVVASAFAILSSKYLKAVAHRFDSLLDTRRFSDTVHHVGQAGALGLVMAAVVVAGIVLCLRAPRLASLVFLGAAIVGVIITPFVFAIPAFVLLNAAAIVFFGRKEIPTQLRKTKAVPANSPAVADALLAGPPTTDEPLVDAPAAAESPADQPTLVEPPTAVDGELDQPAPAAP